MLPTVGLSTLLRITLIFPPSRREKEVAKWQALQRVWDKRTGKDSVGKGDATGTSSTGKKDKGKNKNKTVENGKGRSEEEITGWDRWNADEAGSL